MTDQSMNISSSLNWTMDTSANYPAEIGNLRLQLKQAKIELQSEQDQVSQLRRRLNTAEKERLESASRSNIEVAALESQQARLRTQIEKGEANRHNVEFELTRVKQEWNQYKQAQVDRETLLMTTNDELKEKVRSLSDEVHCLQKKTHSLKNIHEDSGRRYTKDVEEKNNLLARYHAEQDVLIAERDKLNALVMEQEIVLSELSEKVKDHDSDMKNHTDNLRRTLTELDYSKEREARLKTDLETALQRIKLLEENIELERAAHLETKFNSEIVQLRARDLEGGVEVEKSANYEATRSIERLTNQLREIEQVYEEERRTKRDAIHKLDKTEKDYVNIRRQLTSEVDDKKHVINKLSKELEIHQKNFNEVKEELNKAKKKQIQLEENYNGTIKELELILQTFGTSDKPKKPVFNRTKKEDGKIKKVSPNPGETLESIKNVLIDYKKNLDTVTEEMNRYKKTCESQNKELKNDKELIQAKDKSTEETQKNYTRTAKELNRVRSDFGELEGVLARMQIDLQTTSAYSDRDRTRIQELSGEIMKLVQKQKIEEQDRVNYLHGLYQLLLSGRIIGSPSGGGDKPYPKATFTDLSDLIYQQINTLLSMLEQADNKILAMEDALQRRDESLKEIQNSSEDQINKLSVITKERELSWQKQKEEIEGHYSNLLGDLQSRSKKSQSIADQAWEKVRATGNVQQGLQSECFELSNRLQEAQNQNSALLAACALLSGVLFPLLSRSYQLSSQRHIFEEQMSNWDMATERVLYLVNLLNSELGGKSSPRKTKVQPYKRHPLLIFRVGVIAVMAANRLRYFGLCTTSAFITYDSVCSGNSLLICTGGVQPEKHLFQGQGDEDSDAGNTSIKVGESSLVEWLSSPNLLEIVVTSMADLQKVAGQIESKHNPIETRALVGAARGSLCKLLERLSGQFPACSSKSLLSSSRDRHSTVKLLNRCLTRHLSTKPLGEKSNLASSHDLMIALQNNVLDLTSKLHKLEVERNGLLEDVKNLKSPKPIESNQTSNNIIDVSKKSSETSPNIQFVSMEKFERVCEELNSALHREQQAQHLLQEQSRQLTELSTRLELYATDDEEKRHILSATVQDLSENKSELRRKEQTIRQLNKQTMQYEFDKKSFEGNLTDAENALRTAAKDKEVVSNYIRSVEKALLEGKRQLRQSTEGREVTLSQLLLNTDLIPSDISKAGPELIACQNLVAAFIDVYHSASSKIKSLEEEVAAHRQHVEAMKRELSDTIHREYTNQMPLTTPDQYDLTRSQNEFMPLREDSEISFCLSKVNTPVTRKTPSKKTGSPGKRQFGTPKAHGTKSRTSSVKKS